MGQAGGDVVSDFSSVMLLPLYTVETPLRWLSLPAGGTAVAGLSVAGLSCWVRRGMRRGWWPAW
ncbi:hypothetical protein GCM10010442_75460 [Kitasatospora kifunensis]